MNILQVLRHLAQNPEDIFEASMTFDSQNYTYSRQEYELWVNQFGELKYKTKNYIGISESFDNSDTGYGLPTANIDTLSKLKWRQKKEPVFFPEAVQEKLSGKRLLIEYKNKVYYDTGLDLDQLLYKIEEYFNETAEGIIFHGTWYIQPDSSVSQGTMKPGTINVYRLKKREE